MRFKASIHISGVIAAWRSSVPSGQECTVCVYKFGDEAYVVQSDVWNDKCALLFQ